MNENDHAHSQGLPREQRLARSLCIKDGSIKSRMVLVVLDGLGGLPSTPRGLTELETATTPYLDQLTQQGVCGRLSHVWPGVTPGSGPGHLALFGYDPKVYRLGRGVLEGVGIGFPIGQGDVLLRGNFARLDRDSIVVDRKGCGIATDETKKLVEELESIRPLDADVEFIVKPLQEHRFLLVLRGTGLGATVADVDPLRSGVLLNRAEALVPNDRASAKTARVVQHFVDQANRRLHANSKANGVLLRGCSSLPDGIPQFRELYGLRAAAIATYTTYRGLAQLVGMRIIGDPKSIVQQIDLLQSHWEEFDFFFLHYKAADPAGELGDFTTKVKVIEEFDRLLPRILNLKPDVLCITADHCTPAVMKSHSWHPVPVVVTSSHCLPDRCTTFGEREARYGGLGDLRATDLMLILLAHAGRLMKYD